MEAARNLIFGRFTQGCETYIILNQYQIKNCIRFQTEHCYSLLIK